MYVCIVCMYATFLFIRFSAVYRSIFMYCIVTVVRFVIILIKFYACMYVLYVCMQRFYFIGFSVAIRTERSLT